MTPEITRILRELGALSALIKNGTLGKPTVQVAELPIDASEADMVHFDAFAGTIPLAVLGKKSDDSFENIVTAGDNDYTLLAANDIDYLLFQKEGINLPELAQWFKLQPSLKGTGTTIAFTNGLYDKVLYFYLNNGTPAAASVITFETIAGQNTYYNSGLLSITKCIVFYGQALLDNTQYAINGSEIELSIGEPVDAAKPLVVVPVAAENVFTTTEGQSSIGYYGVLPAFIAYGNLIVSKYSFSASEGINLQFNGEAGKEAYIIPRSNLIQIDTANEVDVYSYAALNNIVPAVVIYDQLVLAPGQYEIENGQILVDIGEPIEEGKKLFIIPKP